MEEIKETYAWKEISCLAGRMLVKIPENYKEPSEEELAVKFPVSPRPQEVYISPEGDRIITFNLLDKPLREDQVYPAIREIQRVILRVYPESIRIRARELRTDAGRAGWFAFVTGGIKEDSIHCMFILPLGGSMMFGSYHFPEGTMETERKRLTGMLMSIRPNLPSARKQETIYETKI